MSLIKNITASTLTILCVAPIVLADIETTTVKTTTVTKRGGVVNLPTTTTYIVVDPITGTTKGTFDPVRGVIGVTTITPGLVIIDQNTGKLVATLDPQGKTIDVSTAPAYDPLVAAIDSRRAELSKLIESAAGAGSIDTNQAAALRAELIKIENRETLDKQKNSGFLTYSESLFLAAALNSLADRFVLLTHANNVPPLLGTQFVTSDGIVIMTTNNVEYRRIKLEQRLDDEYGAGRLSAQQVADLREELNAVAALDSKYRKNGELDADETSKLNEKLDSIEEKINKDVAVINEKRSKMGITVQQ